MVREDYFSRGREWPGYPSELFSLYVRDTSTAVVCRDCGHPGSGLRLDRETDTFVHSDPNNCLLNKFSKR